MTKGKRQPIPKSLRFEVFKRDSFTCQYCGRKAPEVVLEIDHIEPVSKGGTNDILNLITACKDCNAGKGDRQLSDATVIDKRHAQLAELQERKEQLEMLFQWQQELLNISEQTLDRLVQYWQQLAPGWVVSETGKNELRKLLSRFSVDIILEAMKTAATSYLEFKPDGTVTEESWDKAWRKLPGICFNRKLSAENPTLARIIYIRGIMRRRFYYINESWALDLMKEAVEVGADVEWLEHLAKTAHNWSEWRREIEDFIDHQQRRNG